MNRRLFAFQHLVTDQRNQYASRDLKSWQGNPEQAEDELAQKSEYDDKTESQRQGLARHPLALFGRVIGGQAKKDGRVGNRIHDGEESKKDR